MSAKTFKIGQEEETNPKKEPSKIVEKTPENKKSGPPFPVSLKRAFVLITILIVLVGLNLGGYYLYKKGYLRTGADIIPEEKSEVKDIGGYAEEINLLPTPN